MKVHYTIRKADISDTDKEKVQKKFEKLHKVLTSKDGLEAHVILSRQRHFCEAEVTLQALNHTLVVTASNTEPLPALVAAIDKLNKQAIKNKHKLIDGRRPERQRGEPLPAVEAVVNEVERAADASVPEDDAGPRVVRSSRVAPKPLTVEEAIIQLEEEDADQVTYRDAETGELRVLLRRRDGGLELVEAP